MDEKHGETNAFYDFEMLFLASDSCHCDVRVAEDDDQTGNDVLQKVVEKDDDESAVEGEHAVRELFVESDGAGHESGHGRDGHVYGNCGHDDEFEVSEDVYLQLVVEEGGADGAEPVQGTEHDEATLQGAAVGQTARLHVAAGLGQQPLSTQDRQNRRDDRRHRCKD